MLVIVNFTGIPYALHYCGMAGAFSNQSCVMCEEQSKPVEKSSCCEDELEDFLVAFTADNNCCKEHVIAAPLKIDAERIISTKKPVQQLSALLVQEISSQNFTTLGSLCAVHIQESPPGIQKQLLSILFSSLLI